MLQRMTQLQYLVPMSLVQVFCFVKKHVEVQRDD